MSSFRHLIGITVISGVLSACGGGGSSTGDSGTQPPPTTPTYTVTTSVSGSGSGSISPTSRSVSQGSTTSFTISPASGSSISGVSGCGGSLSGTTYTTAQITANCTVTASFEGSNTNPPPPTTFTVTTAVTGDGSGTISPISVTVEQGQTVTFTITPDTGSQIGSASGCGGSLSGTSYTTGQITASCTVSISFTSSNSNPPPSSYTVSTTVSGGGSGTISPTSVNVIPGGSASFNIFPDGDSVLASVSGCDGTLSGNTYVTGVINSNCTVAVTFELKQYQVTTTFGEGGTIDPPSRLVAHGSVATFNVLPDEGYSIDQVSGCGGSLSGQTFTTGPITGECSIDATFLINQYTVLATAGENGTISPNSATVDHGQTAIFTVIPDVGYQVETIGGCGGSLEGSTYTTAPVITECEVGVSFSLLTAVGQWSVTVLGRIDAYPEIYPVQLAQDGSALIGYAMRLDSATGRNVMQGFVWREDIGLQSLMLPGDEESYASSISADGTKVFGVSYSEIDGSQESRGFFWRSGSGIEAIGIEGGAFMSIEGASRDGSVAWGVYRTEAGMQEHFLWKEGEGASPFILEGSPARVYAATPDGTIIVGAILEPDVGWSAMRWNRVTGVIDRFRADGDTSANAFDISDDGHVVTGETRSNTSVGAFIWTDASGLQVLRPDGSFYSSAHEVSADGSTILGRHGNSLYNTTLFIWTAERGFEGLMIENDQRSEYLYLGGGSATRTPSLSFNGSRAVGRSCGNDCRGFVWISDVGVIPIGETDQYSDWTNINGMSDDGQRIVGLDGTGDSSFTWTLEDGLERLILHQSPVILSADGSTIAGLICNGVTCEVALLVEN